MTTTTRTAVAAPEPPNRPLTAADLTVADPVWVFAFGRWRRGEVTALARVRVQVRYVSDRHGGTRLRWFAATEQDPVFHGGLPDPVAYRCVGSRCRLVVTGRPGQGTAQIRALHEASPHHHRDLPTSARGEHAAQ
ncbi:hypothetical protein CSH63_32980 [Micromonospora tulbaghiae]|uniref:Uncharacterized protein n=1 Tax=Micromonospora tulbaghiae TaxID=479978 RepID=A0A386WXK5_9ACTN|nr:hypothetical protein [Micromonospora tulbaghiae]AYF32170.1 hypothetical protein CSH63_32980 [Micromonospora tulbaghiae]